MELERERTRSRQEELWRDKSPAPSEAMERYLSFLTLRKRASRHTVSNYRIDLDHFFRFLAESGRLGRWRETMADEATFHAFLEEQGKKYRRSTVLRRLGALKSFLRFLRSEGVLTKSVAKLLRVSPGAAPPPQIPAEAVVQKFLDGLPARNLRDMRIRAAAELLYSAGLRISEVVALDQSALDFRAGTATVKKGGVPRTVPLGRYCQRAVRDYIDALPRALRGRVQAPLLLNRDGERVSVRTLQRDLRAAAKAVLGEDDASLTTHSLRHACASHLLKRGASVQAVRQLLGHRALLTTQKYTEPDEERMHRAYDRLQPTETSAKRRGPRR